MADTRAIETPEKRFQRYNTAQSRMNLWTSLLEDAYRLTIPDRQIFNLERRTPGQIFGDDVFDPVGILGVQAFSNNIQSILMPPFRRWAKLIPGTEVPSNKKQEIEEALQVINATLFKFLDQSNFAQAMNQSLQDFAVGTGILLINEGPVSDPFEFRSVPLGNVSFEAGARDELENFWRRWEIPLRQITRIWPTAQLSEQLVNKTANSPDTLIELIEGSIFYPDNAEGSQHYYYVQDVGTKKDLVTEFRDFSPFMGFRFSTSPGEIVGRGPVLTALPTLRMLNTLVEFVMRSAKFKAFPPFLAVGSGTFNPYNLVIEPGSIIQIDAPIGGVTPIQPLQTGGDPNFTALQVKEMQAMVREILFAEPLQPEPTPNQTATEVAIRQQNWVRRSGTAFGRITRELLEPVIRNTILILSKKGLIDKVKVDGKEVAIQYESPLLDLQSQEDVTRAQQWLQSLQATYGQFAILALEATEYPAWLAEKMNVDLKLVKDAASVSETFQQLQQQVQSQLGGQGQGEGQEQAPIPAAEPGQIPPTPPFTGQAG